MGMANSKEFRAELLPGDKVGYCKHCEENLMAGIHHNCKAAPTIGPADPWAHRTAGMRCTTCMWFVEKVDGAIVGTKRKGRCRRHAPTMSGYPVVFTDDWCGDHKLA